MKQGNFELIGELSVELLQSINSDIANHFKVIPKLITDLKLDFYIDEKINSKEDVSSQLELLLDKKINLHPIDSALIQKALAKHYRTTENKKASEYDNDFLNDLIFNAKQISASDIHIEIFDENARVRLRIDGKLIETNIVKKENYQELINQIKIKSNLDITEKRLPQDGRIEFDDFDIRVSILPTHHGEKVVMRLLGRDASHLNLKDLGFENHQIELYLNAVKKTNGIVLISGPTGSGKTTTLYATLKSLNNINTNIVTVEDPIEYTLKGINQVQLKENIGLTFSSALRSFLRQDPDIIMLGEIRDGETAQMAVRASLTGHLVLSTIHTNSSLGTISRLIDMGVPPFLLAETVNISVAQRLVRKLCENCKEEVTLNPNELPKSYSKPFKIEKHFVSKGCDLCYHTGYKGRKAIYEVLLINNEIVENIKNGDISKLNISEEETLSYQAYKYFSEGKTTLDEIYPMLLNN